MSKMKSQEKRKGKYTLFHKTQSVPNIEPFSTTNVPPSNKVLKENSQLKSKNRLLMEELQKISIKVDKQLSKRVEMKNIPKSLPQEVHTMQLNNALKLVQIYKKENESLKGRIIKIQDINLQDLTWKITDKEKLIEHLKKQIQILRKVNRLQQKAIKDHVAKQNFKEALPKNQYQHKRKYTELCIPNSLEKPRETPSRNAALSTMSNKHKQRSKTFEKESHESSGEFLSLNKDITKNSIEIGNKDAEKIRKLQIQKRQQRQIIENLKQNLIQKDKEISELKKKLYEIKIKSKPADITKRNKTQTMTTNLEQIKRYTVLEQEQNLQQTGKLKNKNYIHKMQQYPKIKSIGVSLPSAAKWNDHQFKGKIKELKVLVNKNGTISNIHARYQTGQRELKGKLKDYKVFNCTEPTQFVNSISGSMKKGVLQHLKIRSNLGRVGKFGHFESPQGKEFQLCGSDSEYPLALYGQITNEAITLLGCQINRQ